VDLTDLRPLRPEFMRMIWWIVGIIWSLFVQS